MLVLKESYFDDFKCSADKCIDTCCKGWKITIDKGTYKKYKNISGKFGIKLKNNIEINNKDSFGGYGKIKLNDKGECPFLNNNNLCEVYEELSPDDMCITCKIYPRRMNYTNDIMEKSLVLSCPEVAKIFVNQKAQMDFVIEEQDELIDYEQNITHKEMPKEEYKFLFEIRSFAIEIMQYSIISIWKRFYFLLRFLEMAQEKLNQNKYNEFDEIINQIRLEITDEEIINTIDKIDKNVKIKLSYIGEYTEVKFSNDLFKNFRKSYEELKKENNDIEKQWICKEEKFEKYFSNNEIILENYLVHQIYVSFMVEDIDYNEVITKIIANYTIFKAILTLEYDKAELTDYKLIEIIYKYCRKTGENNPQLDKIIYEQFSKCNYNDKVYLISFIR